MTIINGESFGKYKILSEIGKGGMGEVYLAQDANLNRKVAIKFLSEEFSKDSEKLNRFIQEAQATSALNHPNILTVYEIDEFEDDTESLLMINPSLSTFFICTKKVTATSESLLIDVDFSTLTTCKGILG